MENLANKMYKVSQNRKAETEHNKGIYKERSRCRLMTILEKKMKTSFIGALSQFEQHFGYLWGFGKQDGQLNSNELKFKRMWEDVRTNILNNGNNQLRAMQNELNEYDISWNRHSLTIPVIPRNSEEV